MDAQEIESEPDNSSSTHSQNHILEITIPLEINDSDANVAAVSEVVDVEACSTALITLKRDTTSELPIDIDKLEPFMVGSRNQYFASHNRQIPTAQFRPRSGIELSGNDSMIYIDNEIYSEHTELPTLNYQCPICMRSLDKKSYSKTDGTINPGTDHREDNLDIDHRWSATRCGHIFCENCIKTSLKRKRICPVCRTSLFKPADVIPLYF